MHTTPRWSTLAAALSISLTACEGLPTEPTLGLETGEAALSLASLTHTGVLIDFEGLPTTGTGVTLFAMYSEDGFTLVHSGGGFSSPGINNPIYVQSKTLFPFPDDGGTSLTKDGGGVFDVLSIDLAEAPWFISLLGPVPVTFTGTKTDESVVEETFMTDGSLQLQTFTFDTSLFTGLVSLSWTQAPSFLQLHQFDNIVLSFHSSDPSPTDPDPVTRDDCKKGGWDTFEDRFRNQGQCVRFVERNENRKDKR